MTDGKEPLCQRKVPGRKSIETRHPRGNTNSKQATLPRRRPPTIHALDRRSLTNGQNNRRNRMTNRRKPRLPPNRANPTTAIREQVLIPLAGKNGRPLIGTSRHGHHRRHLRQREDDEQLPDVRPDHGLEESGDAPVAEREGVDGQEDLPCAHDEAREADGGDEAEAALD